MVLHVTRNAPTTPRHQFTPDGSFQSKLNGCVLDIAERSRNEGAPLVAWPPGGSKGGKSAAWQKFTLPRAHEDDASFDQPGTIGCFMHGLFLSVESFDGAVQPGTRVCMHSRAGHGESLLQRWRIILQ